MVTDAAESESGWAKMDGFVRTQIRNRELMPTLKLKKDYMNGFNAQQEQQTTKLSNMQFSI